MNKIIFDESNIKIFFSTYVHKNKIFKLIFTFLIIKIFFKNKIKCGWLIFDCHADDSDKEKWNKYIDRRREADEEHGWGLHTGTRRAWPPKVFIFFHIYWSEHCWMLTSKALILINYFTTWRFCISKVEHKSLPPNPYALWCHVIQWERIRWNME